MVLSTFGAIMGFAAEIVGQTKETYEGFIGKAGNPALKETFRALAEEEKKNGSLMEKTRRENVTEMILEPITGLQREDYEIDLKRLEQKDDGDLLKIALILEERARKFFQDAAAKVPLPEVARIFVKINQKKEQNLGRLQSLGLTQTLNKDS